MRLFRVFITSISGYRTDNKHMYKLCRTKWNGNPSKLATSFSALVAVPNKVGMNLLQLLQLNSLQFFFPQASAYSVLLIIETNLIQVFLRCSVVVSLTFPFSNKLMNACVCLVLRGVSSGAESAVAIMRTDRNLTNGEISHQRFSLHTVSSPRGIDCTECSMRSACQYAHVGTVGGFWGEKLSCVAYYILLGSETKSTTMATLVEPLNGGK